MTCKIVAVLVSSCILLVVIGTFTISCDTSKKQNTDAEHYINEVALIDSSGLDSLIQERNGKVLLINMWATWCVPCREEFEDLIQLAAYATNKPIEIVGISVDYPDEIESKVKPFLAQQQVNFKIYVQNFDEQEALINQLNKDWSGALPASFIYDARGKQKVFVQGKHTLESFKKLLAAL